MVSVTKQMRTETSHLLPGHDGRCKNIHGHSYLWEVTLKSSQLMLNGMVEDFGHLKARMTQVIDPYDHCLVLFDEDPLTKPLIKLLEENGVERLMLVEWMPTAENFAQQVAYQLKQFYPTMIVSVKVWETATSYAEYTES